MTKVKLRDISPALQALRNFLLGRKHTVALRFEPLLASRSPPPPDIPDGPAHLHAANYYCKRDARREVTPPLDVLREQALLAESSAKGEAREASVTKKTPGKVFNWDTHNY